MFLIHSKSPRKSFANPTHDGKEVRDFESYKERLARAKPKLSKKRGSRQDDESTASKMDLVRDEASEEPSPWLGFKPEAAIEQFSFADQAKISKEELENLIRGLQYTGMQPHFIDALRRGLGVHHAGMNRQYRQV
jgi:hypothetical protein